jgi:hypothetical protein
MDPPATLRPVVNADMQEAVYPLAVVRAASGNRRFPVCTCDPYAAAR